MFRFSFYLAILLFIPGTVFSQSELHYVNSFPGGDVAFFYISDISISSDGLHFYLLDQPMNKVYKINKNGDIEAVAGRDGHGPGEFSGGPIKIIENNDELMIFDKSPVSTVQVFDSDLNYITTRRIRFGDDVALFDDGQLLLHYHDYRNNTYFLIYNFDGDKLESLSVDVPSKNYTRINRAQISKIDRIGYVILFTHFNQIQFFDHALNLKKSLKLDFLPEKSPVELAPGAEGIISRFTGERRDIVYRSSYFPEFRIFESLTVDNSSKVYIQVNQLISEVNDNIFVFDFNGQLIDSFVLPDGQILKNVRDNYLFTVSSSRDSVSIYRID